MKQLYAGKIILTPKAAVRLMIRDRYSLHRVVWDLFSGADPGRKRSAQASGIQWADRGEHLVGREILLLSDRKPQIEGLAEDVRVFCKELPLAFLDSQRYRIRMDVNPTRQRMDGRRVAVPRSELDKWLKQKAERSGFSLENYLFRRYGTSSFRKDGAVLTFCEVQVDGILTVLDKERFKETFVKGFGRGRAFGYGLMQIVPLR